MRGCPMRASSSADCDEGKTQRKKGYIVSHRARVSFIVARAFTRVLCSHRLRSAKALTMRARSTWCATVRRRPSTAPTPDDARTHSRASDDEESSARVSAVVIVVSHPSRARRPVNATFSSATRTPGLSGSSRTVRRRPSSVVRAHEETGRRTDGCA